MNSTYFKKLWIIPLIMVGVLLVLAVLFSSLAMAAEGAQIQAAINELRSVSGQNIDSQDQARFLCNQEKYLDICANIGKKHDLYTPEEVKQVDSFLGEVKGKILDDIKSCADEECLIRVASELAVKIKTKNPTLATNLNLTTKIVAEKQAVVQAAKEVGVSFSDCESMDPDSAPIDLLRKCAKLAKDTRVQKYIPEEKRVLTDQFGDTTTIKLREALSAGKYQCGDNTLEGCGNFCLNPDTATRVAGISPVCKQIASEIFGQEGVKQLEAAHQQVGQVKDYYSKKFILTLPDGKELVGESQIRKTCDQAFSSQNIEIAKACGNFAVKNGLADQVEVEKGIKLMESFAQKGQNVNFDQCLTNPTACRNFLPAGEQKQFDAGNQIFEIMKTEIGFDPSQCERGAVDEAIGIKCSEGSKRALVKIESLGLASQSKEARFIIEDIKSHLSEGENFAQKKDKFKQVFQQKGGPGGCKSESECFTYCSDPAHGPECISFGSQQGISGFKGQEAVQRFQEYNNNLQRPGLISDEYRPFPPSGDVIYPPGQFPGFNQPGPGFSPPPGNSPYYSPYPGPTGPSPECFAAIQSGDFVRAKTVCISSVSLPVRSVPICPASFYVECPAGQYRESFKNNDGCWIDGPCKSAPTYSSVPTFTPSGDPAVDCQKSGGTWDTTTKYCKYPVPIYSPYPTGGPYPTYAPPSGQKNQIWNSKGLSSYIRADADSARIERLKTACVNVSNGVNVWMPGAGDYASNDFGMPDPIKCEKVASCSTSQYFDGASCVSSSPYPTYSYSPYPTATGSTGGMYSCFYPNASKNGKYPGYTVWCEKDYFNCHEGSKTGTSVGLDGLSLGAPSSCESGYQGQSCNSNKFCDSNETYTSCPSDCGGTTYSPYPSPGSGSCPTGYHSHGESGGFCMNDQENYSGTCYNSAGTNKITCPAQPTYSPYPSSSPTSSGSCPSGSHTMYVNNAGGYCMSDADPSKCGTLNSTNVSSFGSCSSYQATATYSPGTSASYTPAPSCPSGQYWDYSLNSCKSNTSYGGCSGTTQSSCTSVSNCYWNSSSNYCYYQSTSPSTTTYTPYPSPGTCPSGQWWDYTTSSCKSNTSTSPYPTTTSCGTGYFWDSANSTCKSTCSSTQYWNGGACVDNPTTTYTPYPSTEYTPYPTTTYTPYPTTEYTPSPTYSESPPPPTSGLYPQFIAMHCQQLGRTWNGSTCQSNGLFVRFYENNLANILRLFYIVP